MASRTISTSAEEILPHNSLRKSFVISNEDASIPVYVKQESAATPTVSATDHDHRVGPGGVLAVNYGLDGLQAIQSRWTIVADSGTPRIAYFETEDVRR